MPAILAFAMQLLAAAPGLLSAGEQGLALFRRGQDKLKQFQDEGNRAPTDEEWDWLNQSIAAKRDILHSN